MIHGVVNVNLEATIRLHVAWPNGPWQEVTAIIDTGYNGALSLPLSAVTALTLQPSVSRMVTLGDASQRVFDFYGVVTLTPLPCCLSGKRRYPTPLW